MNHGMKEVCMPIFNLGLRGFKKGIKHPMLQRRLLICTLTVESVQRFYCQTQPDNPLGKSISLNKDKDISTITSIHLFRNDPAIKPNFTVILAIQSVTNLKFQLETSEISGPDSHKKP